MIKLSTTKNAYMKPTCLRRPDCDNFHAPSSMPFTSRCSSCVVTNDWTQCIPSTNLSDGTLDPCNVHQSYCPTSWWWSLGMITQPSNSFAHDGQNQQHCDRALMLSLSFAECLLQIKQLRMPVQLHAVISSLIIHV